MVLFTKKDDVGLIRNLASDSKAMRWRAEATTAKLAEREAELRELELKGYLLVEEAKHAGDLQKLFDAKEKELETLKRDLEAKTSVPKEQSRDKGTREMESKAARADTGRRERLIHDFAERVCTGFTTLMHG